MKKIILFFFAAFFTMNLSAQTVEELKAMQAEKSAAAAALQAEADALQAKIDAFPGWKIGGLGVIGFNLFKNNAWYSIRQAHSSQNSIGLGFTAFANYDQDKLFWRNGLTINMTKTDAIESENSPETETVADKLGINSLAGYKLTDKIALSAEASYASSVLNFNNPGSLTISAGATWLPIQDLVVIIHPIGYQINFPDADFNSTAGAKIGATYTKEIIPGVMWNTSLNAFLAYGEGDIKTVDPIVENGYSRGEMSNWNWENGFGFSVWKGIGVGLNVGLAGNKQQVDAYRAFADGDDVYKPETDDSSADENPLQWYYNLGLSYGF